MVTPLRRALAGREEKGDVIIKIEPADNGGDVKIFLEKLKIDLFDEQIRRVVYEHAKALEIEDANIYVYDNGALDFAIRARLEAAFERSILGGEEK